MYYVQIVRHTKWFQWWGGSMLLTIIFLNYCFNCFSRSKLANSLLNSYLLFPESLQAHLTFLTLLLYTGYVNIMYCLFQKLILSLIWFILGASNHYTLHAWSRILNRCFFIYERGRLMIPQVMGISDTYKRVDIVVLLL